MRGAAAEDGLLTRGQWRLGADCSHLKAVAHAVAYAVVLACLNPRTANCQCDQDATD